MNKEELAQFVAKRQTKWKKKNEGKFAVVDPSKDDTSESEDDNDALDSGDEDEGNDDSDDEDEEDDEDDDSEEEKQPRKKKRKSGSPSEKTPKKRRPVKATAKRTQQKSRKSASPARAKQTRTLQSSPPPRFHPQPQKSPSVISAADVARARSGRAVATVDTFTESYLRLIDVFQSEDRTVLKLDQPDIGDILAIPAGDFRSALAGDVISEEYLFERFEVWMYEITSIDTTRGGEEEITIRYRKRSAAQKKTKLFKADWEMPRNEYDTIVVPSSRTPLLMLSSRGRSELDVHAGRGGNSGVGGGRDYRDRDASRGRSGSRGSDSRGGGSSSSSSSSSGSSGSSSSGGR